MKTQQEKPDLDLIGRRGPQTAELTIILGGEQTHWKWIFASPGHPQSIKYQDEKTREVLTQAAMRDEAISSGRRYTPTQESPEEQRARNIEWVSRRLVGWTPTTINGEDFPFTIENARKLMGDFDNWEITNQAIAFLSDQKSFTRRSATS